MVNYSYSSTHIVQPPSAPPSKGLGLMGFFPIYISRFQNGPFLHKTRRPPSPGWSGIRHNRFLPTRFQRQRQPAVAPRKRRAHPGCPHSPAAAPRPARVSRFGRTGRPGATAEAQGAERGPRTSRGEKTQRTLPPARGPVRRARPGRRDSSRHSEHPGSGGPARSPRRQNGDVDGGEEKQ